MYHLYKKNESNFSLVWIIVYVVLFSIADSFSASLGMEKIIAAPYGLFSFNGSLRNYLYFIPLLLSKLGMRRKNAELFEQAFYGKRTWIRTCVQEQQGIHFLYGLKW